GLRHSEASRHRLRGCVFHGNSRGDASNSIVLQCPIDDRARCLSRVAAPPRLGNDSPADLDIALMWRTFEIYRADQAMRRRFDDKADPPQMMTGIALQRREVPRQAFDRVSFVRPSDWNIRADQFRRTRVIAGDQRANLLRSRWDEDETRSAQLH